jgi:hypothetical protein
MGIITKGLSMGRAYLRNQASKKALKTASSSKLKLPVIKSVKPAKNLTSRRKTRDEMVDLVNKQYKTKAVKPGQSGSKIKKEATSKASTMHDDYEKSTSTVRKYNRRLKQKTFGGATAAIAGTVGAHSAAKKKFPKYKKFMEQDIAVKDGKLKLVPKWKKDATVIPKKKK